MEIRTELQVYKVEKICPGCEFGKMYWNQVNNFRGLITDYHYKHTCSFCGHVKWYDTYYPRKEYKVKEGITRGLTPPEFPKVTCG